MTPPACLSGLAVVFRRLGPYHWARLRAASERQALLAIELTADTTEYG